jgi:hypothetical protein
MKLNKVEEILSGITLALSILYDVHLCFVKFGENCSNKIIFEWFNANSRLHTKLIESAPDALIEFCLALC